MTEPRVTLVTGGGSGIGAALCRRIAGPGQTIFIHTGRNRDKADAVAADLRAAGATAHVVVAEFGTPENGRAVIEAIEARVGRLDALVHLAGMANRRLFGELTAEEFEASMSVMVRSFFHMVSAAHPMLLKANQGRVVTTGSWVAHRYSHNPEWLFRQWYTVMIGYTGGAFNCEQTSGSGRCRRDSAHAVSPETVA